jgi:glucose/arabinose dehydrogenase
MAFHPNLSTNGYFYIFYTASTSNNLKIDRYTISTSNSNEANISSKLEIINIPHTYSNHNGGELHFGKDGFLYVSIGDGGSGGDPENNGQNSGALNGKILRINVNATSGGNNYSIPAGNPFNNLTYCFGLRNPYRWSFDRYNGDLYIGDVGQSTREEVDYLPASQIAGANFGWKCWEGSFQHSNASSCLPFSSYVGPIFQYPTVSGNQSVIGGNVYRGYKYPDFKGYYFTCDYYSDSIRTIKNNGTSWQVKTTFMNTSFENVSDFGETEDGELFVVDLNNNLVRQVINSNSKIVYTFTGSGAWMTASNWKDGAVPPNPLPSGSVIVIKPNSGNTCTLTMPRTISTGADIFVEPGTNFIVNSNLTVD